jgi:hypothetical protein
MISLGYRSKYTDDKNFAYLAISIQIIESHHISQKQLQVHMGSGNTANSKVILAECSQRLR